MTEQRIIDLLAKSATLAAQGQADAALLCLEEGVRQAPTEVEIWARLGGLFGRAGARENCVAALRRAMLLAPEREATHRSWIAALSHWAEARHAVQPMRRLARLVPGDAEVWSAAIHAATKHGREDLAEIECRCALPHHPGRAEFSTLPRSLRATQSARELARLSAIADPQAYCRAYLGFLAANPWYEAAHFRTTQAPPENPRVAEAFAEARLANRNRAFGWMTVFGLIQVAITAELAFGGLWLAAAAVVIAPPALAILAEAAFRIPLFLRSRVPGETLVAPEIDVSDETIVVSGRPIMAPDRACGFAYIADADSLQVVIEPGPRVAKISRARINAEGAVGVSLNGPQDTPADALKILVVGDSFTAQPANGLNWNGITNVNWPDMFERDIAAALGRPVCVRNAGRAGYGLLQMVDAAAALAEQERPDFVILAYITDDFWRERFWVSSVETSTGLRAFRQADPDGRGFARDTALIEPRVDENWARAHAERIFEDEIWRRVRDRFAAMGRRVHPRAQSITDPRLSFLLRRIQFGDALALAHEDEGRRIRVLKVSEFISDPGLSQRFDRLQQLDVPVALAHLPKYDEIVAGDDLYDRIYAPGNPLALMRDALETAAGSTTHRLHQHISLGDLTKREFQASEEDPHPALPGMALYSKAMVTALAEQISRIVPARKEER
jgi:hypothetical protein